MFKMSSGKYIAPQVIENKLKESLFIEQAMVVGENEKFVSALISPNFSFVHNWCSRHEINFENNSELIQIPEVIARFQKEINAINNLLGEHEKIKRFRLVPTSGVRKQANSPDSQIAQKNSVQNYDSILVEIYRHEKNHETKGVRGRSKLSFFDFIRLIFNK